MVKLRKAGHIKVEALAAVHYNLLPEFYLRKQESNYVDLGELQQELEQIKSEIASMAGVK